MKNFFNENIFKDDNLNIYLKEFIFQIQIMDGLFNYQTRRFSTTNNNEIKAII